MITGLSLLLPIVDDAEACGGLFIHENSNQPVNQVAENILFALEPDTGLQMHVSLHYEGPPEEFSWLLPVPRGTTFGLSRTELFRALDQNYQPTFNLQTTKPQSCQTRELSQSYSPPSMPDFGNDSGGVQVSSHAQVGPYEQVTLRGEASAEIIAWLQENGYQVPNDVEEVLNPYLEDYEFIAIKLLEGRESGEIQPLGLHIPTETLSLPLRIASVAARPDMGLIIHFLGSSRAVPTNYQHVDLNYAALDWFNPSTHYTQLVSHAVDEASEGRAFVTEFAGPHFLSYEQVAPVLSTSIILAMEEVRDAQALYQVMTRMLTDQPQVDLNQVLLSVLPFEREVTLTLIDYASNSRPISDVQVSALLQDDEGQWLDVDGQATAEALSHYNQAGQLIQRAFSNHHYLTRLYTTLNPSEMTVDPTFDFNPDLGNQDRVRQADLFLTCFGGHDYIATPDGLKIDLDDQSHMNYLQRQEGETVQGSEVIGAALITQHTSSGQPEILQDRREELAEFYVLPKVDEGFGCQQRRAPHPVALIFIYFGFLFLRPFYGRRDVSDVT